MIRFLVEMEGRSVDVSQLPECEIRNTLHPITELLSGHLINMSEHLDVVFHIDEDGILSLKLRGSAIAINEARDAIGEEMIISNIFN